MCKSGLFSSLWSGDHFSGGNFQANRTNDEATARQSRPPSHRPWARIICPLSCLGTLRSLRFRRPIHPVRLRRPPARSPTHRPRHGSHHILFPNWTQKPKFGLSGWSMPNNSDCKIRYLFSLIRWNFIANRIEEYEVILTRFEKDWTWFSNYLSFRILHMFYIYHPECEWYIKIMRKWF